MPHLSIGEVLGLLLEEFPDVTISKIRFLESQGLIDPERTPSGYRKFYDDDVELLRCILREQRENYLPLRVIKDRIDSGEIDPTGEQLRPRGIRNVGSPTNPALHGPRPAERPMTPSRSPARLPCSCAPTVSARRHRPPSRRRRRRRCSIRRHGLRPTGTGRRHAVAPTLLPGVLLDARELCSMSGITERPTGRSRVLRGAGAGIARRASRCTTRMRSRSPATPSASSTPASTLVICAAGASPPNARPACSISSSSRCCANATRRPARSRIQQLVELEAIGGRLRSAMMREALRPHMR